MSTVIEPCPYHQTYKYESTPCSTCMIHRQEIKRVQEDKRDLFKVYWSAKYNCSQEAYFRAGEMTILCGSEMSARAIFLENIGKHLITVHIISVEIDLIEKWPKDLLRDWDRVYESSQR